MYTDREELSWAAGFFDGEGNTSLKIHRKRYATVAISIPNTHRPNLRRFQKALGGLGYINGPVAKGPECKDCWVLEIQSFEEAQATIAMLWFKLGEEKRNQALEVLKKYKIHRDTFKPNPNWRGPSSKGTRVPQHGTLSEYANHKCRCAECSFVTSNYNRRRYLERK